jgi:gas vesicle protein
MGIITNILKEEYERLKSLESQYIQKIQSLPKGALSKRKRSGNFYLYLVFRDRQKVITQYVGKLESNRAREIMKQVEERKQIEEKLKKVQSDLKELQRVLK